MTLRAPAPAARYLLDTYQIHMTPKALVTAMDHAGKVERVSQGHRYRTVRMVSEEDLDQYVKDRIAKQKSGERKTGVGKGINLQGPGSYQHRASRKKLTTLAIVREKQLAKWTAARVKDEVVVLRSGVYE